MKFFTKILPVPLLFILFFCFCGAVQAADLEERKSLKVGVRWVKPFIFLDEQEPRGFAIDLWQALSEELGFSSTYVPSQGISHGLSDIINERIDIAIGAITVTKEREEKIDFSYPNFHTGLGILVPMDSNLSIAAFMRSFFYKQRLQNIGFFLLFLIISGHVIWLAERRTDHNFHRNYFPGVFEGIYWSIVTASTVGYGDYAPKSKTGRVLAIVVIIVSLPLFAMFIGNISSNITLHELRTSISGPGDLVDRRVGVLAGSTAQKYVDGIAVQKLYSNESIEDAYQQLHDGQLDAIVHDRPTLQYYQEHGGKGKVKVLDATFAKQNYAIAMAQNSPYREEINRVLLELIENGRYSEIREAWFGKEKL